MWPSAEESRSDRSMQGNRQRWLPAASVAGSVRTVVGTRGCEAGLVFFTFCCGSVSRIDSDSESQSSWKQASGLLRPSEQGSDRLHNAAAISSDHPLGDDNP